MATIYALVCDYEDKAYIGCTKGNLGKRLREHRCLLRSGKHTCRPLQDLWDKHGGECFTMQSLGVCADDLASRRAAELAAMDAAGDRLINDKNSFQPSPEATRRGIEASRYVEGRKRSPEANLKRSLAQKGKPKGHGAKISATKQAQKLQRVMI